jgi:transcriptional regulator with XRE-family HTH domain
MASSTPTVVQRRLARRLRKLREDAGLTIDQVAKQFDLSASTISRLETAQATARRGDIRELADIYRITGAQRDELLQLAEESRRHLWWEKFKDLPHAPVADLEAEAKFIRHYAAQLVPGLLQTEAYAREVLRALRGDSETGDLERRLEHRMKRQALLTQPTSPQYLVVLDETVARRTVGGAGVMRGQLERLIEASALPNVTLRLLPFTYGAHAGLDGKFAIYSYEKPNGNDLVDEDPDVVFLENLEGNVYIEDPKITERYNRTFERLLDAALDAAASSRFLTDIADQLRNP